MFLGHYAAAFAAKRFAPKTSLGTLFLSSQFVDLLWPLFLLLGIEHVRIEPGNTIVTPLNFYDYPFSHSFLTAVFWSSLLGVLYFAINRYKKGALVVGICVFSHWLLDFIVHRPDLPLVPGRNIYVGLGLWNSLLGTFLFEIGIFIIGLMLYLRTTVAEDRIGKYSLWLLIIVLVIIYISSIFGPPPPNVRAIAIAGNALWLFILWAYWIDRHRKADIWV